MRYEVEIHLKSGLVKTFDLTDFDAFKGWIRGRLLTKNLHITGAYPLIEGDLAEVDGRSPHQISWANQIKRERVEWTKSRLVALFQDLFGVKDSVGWSMFLEQAEQEIRDLVDLAVYFAEATRPQAIIGNKTATKKPATFANKKPAPIEHSIDFQNQFGQGMRRIGAKQPRLAKEWKEGRWGKQGETR